MTELQDVYDILDAFINLIDQFFTHLVNGRLEKAKMARKNMGVVLSSYQNMIRKYQASFESYGVHEDLLKTASLLFEGLNELDARINATILELTEREFISDFDTWQNLLKSEFEEMVKKTKKIADDEKTGLEKIMMSAGEEKRFLFVKRVVKLSSYEDACKKYATWRDQIKKKEELILTASKYNPNLHEIWQTGKWENHRHARLTGNLRIMYKDELGILIFEDILTKNELDNS